eukprot:CAMPEP_0175072110 /NCGR_PEP_ID=MMETSP0052_2-20121109/19688_1 /TAXON_ID=51329 ORGANISM="Polytomella parva, Strain SAG 63-3" /NCGR_SAMPLE_ID=MMETSP0052_2 /ASSEMBLY_ACC=CAM_ASM_000194 /LENGTH=82 /DNA_ID=CAMNT_0016339499 /DNA_START=778 /DNA_END=1026 /DNA_ORIENTATION=-
MRLRLHTGFLSTPHLKMVGSWPSKCPVKNPPWLPPTTDNRFGSTAPAATAALTAVAQSIMSIEPIFPGNAAANCCPYPVLPR